jgi:hypothetical protein
MEQGQIVGSAENVSTPISDEKWQCGTVGRRS